MPEHRLSDWLLLATLVALWGSSFLLTKIALATLSPSIIVAGRLALGAVVLLALLAGARKRLPAPGRLWMFLLAIAITGNCLPFYLISWGQQRIDSGLAGILMAVMPLATISLAHFLVPGERMNANKTAGFVLGFIGIVVLMGPDALLDAAGASGKLIAELAVLSGALCYAVTTIITRRRPPGDALGSSAGVLLIAGLIMSPIVFGAEPRAITEISVASALALCALGVFSTGAATIVYFKLIESAGPSFLSQINYLIPLWATFAGALVLNEKLDWHHMVALAIILAGIALAQWRPRRGPAQQGAAG
ncbi:MAG: DMT family transporter [Gammaproteobacteria bacterium]